MSVAFAVLTAEITHRKFGEKFGTNSVKPFSFFGAFFGALFGEQLFALTSEKFAQNPFCKRDPLTEGGFNEIRLELYYTCPLGF